jgi:hypothetical protein
LIQEIALPAAFFSKKVVILPDANLFLWAPNVRYDPLGNRMKPSHTLEPFVFSRLNPLRESLKRVIISKFQSKPPSAVQDARRALRPAALLTRASRILDFPEKQRRSAPQNAGLERSGHRTSCGQSVHAASL